ncbi:adenosine deaminase [Cellulosimicrobium arenosum]|uniref:adenosine deaminase n=1 Tax=Cellulosimicrobium arenosum TaxID=2708133 RepID=A0A927G7V6_9MICO|nr:adenosine deaminase [Cellulosimicrobium arenosum]MBD8078087.1 adenosine deaminase [Cellulosimicrobium arenosum]
MTIENRALTGDVIRALPKVVLHDHLDGGLRPATVLELAAEVGHDLPASDAESLASWFADAADSGSLERYLETFDHTLAVMQTPEALARVAREAVLDLAADGVVYAEQRWAPEQHLRRGLTLQATVDAVQRGLDEGVAEAAAQGRTIRVGQLVTAMRHADRWQEIAELAVANRANGVVGFDIAGAEDGFPPSRHAEIWSYLAENDFPVTIHAGEAAGPESVAAAVHLGQASRIGHGVRLVEDIAFDPGHPHSAPGESGTAALGQLAHWVRDHQIPLELCPSSNVQTGAATSIAQHPITRLKELDFAVTLNTDNRLMSRTSMTQEMTLLVEQAGWTIDDLADVTMTAAWNAFVHHDERRALVDDVILPGYQLVEGAQL